tara:strand:- start:213 stop:1124 length:912 start_codon:yes stop_codon:yes gene_type:complete
MRFFKNYPNLTVVIACLFWGTYWIPLRFVDSGNNSSVWPIVISFFLLSLFIGGNFKKSLNNIFIVQKNYFFLAGCFFASLGIGLYSESLLRGDIAKVVVLFYLAPIWGTVFAKLFLKKLFGLNRIIAIVLGLIGLEIIVGIEKGIFIPTELVEWIAILAGISWALGTTFFHLAKPTNSIEKTSFTGFMVSILFIFFCFIPGGRNLDFPISLINLNIVYFWIISFSIFWLLPSILLTYFSVEILDPGRINILLAFEVVVGFASAALLTNELIGAREIMGAIFVVSSCFVDVVFEKKYQKNIKKK